MNQHPLFPNIPLNDYQALIKSYSQKFNKILPDLCTRLQRAIPDNIPVYQPQGDLMLLCDLMTSCIPSAHIGFYTSTPKISSSEEIIWLMKYRLSSQKMQQAFGFQVLPLYTKLMGFLYFKKEVNKLFPSSGDITVICSSDSLPEGSVYQTNTFIETQELTHFLLNPNSLELLPITNTYSFFKEKSNECMHNLLHFREWLRSLSPYERSHVMVFSSTTLFSIGLRTCNDVDVFINHQPTLPKSFNKSYENLGKYGEVYDISMRGEGEWKVGGQKEHWDEWFLREWPQLIGANSMNEIVYEPRYHMYFLGMKVTSLEMDIARRIKRERPAGYANLIALQKISKIPIDFPKVPNEYYKSIGVKNVINTPQKLERFYRTIQNYLNHRYHLQLSLQQIKKLILPPDIIPA